jgi:hypothetical protein
MPVGIRELGDVVDYLGKLIKKALRPKFNNVSKDKDRKLSPVGFMALALRAKDSCVISVDDIGLYC